MKFLLDIGFYNKCHKSHISQNVTMSKFFNILRLIAYEMGGILGVKNVKCIS